MTRKILYFVIVLFFLMILPTSQATMTSRNCTAGYAWTNMTLYINDGNVTNMVVNSVPVKCQYGCAPDGLDCAEPVQNDSGVMLTIGIILGVVSFLFIYLAKNLEFGGKKYSWPLTYLFVFAALLFIVINVGLLAGYNTLTQTTITTILEMGYMASIFILMVLLGAFMLLLIIKASEWLQGKKGDDDAKD